MGMFSGVFHFHMNRSANVAKSKASETIDATETAAPHTRVEATVRIVGTSPLSWGRHFQAAPGPEGETYKDAETRTWRERMHYGGDDKHVCIPPMALKRCLDDAAMFLGKKVPGRGQSTYTKSFVAAVLAFPVEGDEESDGLITLRGSYDKDAKRDLITRETIQGEWQFVPSNGKRGGGSRVDKCFPFVKFWECDVTFVIMDATITEAVFLEHFRKAGKFIGLGRFRPRNGGYYGRFTIATTTDATTGEKIPMFSWEPKFDD
jgi:hypothetical protein